MSNWKYSDTLTNCTSSSVTKRPRFYWPTGKREKENDAVRDGRNKGEVELYEIHRKSLILSEKKGRLQQKKRSLSEC